MFSNSGNRTVADHNSKTDGYYRGNTLSRTQNDVVTMPASNAPESATPGQSGARLDRYNLQADRYESRDDIQNWLGRLMDLNLVLLILFVGVPVLVYCIVETG